MEQQLKKRDDFIRFYEEVGANYPEEKVVYAGLRGRLRKEFIALYLEDAKGSFLDIGCNAGTYFDFMKGDRVVGIDLSFSILRKARERSKSLVKSNRYDFLVGDAQVLNFLRPNQFDLILCSEVLEHLLEPQKVFAGIANLLKPGGKALITTPNYRNQKPTWVPLAGLKSFVEGDTYYHTAYRPEELMEMALQEDLRIMESGTLEWQIKYAAKLPALKYVVYRFLNRHLFKSEGFDRLNFIFYEKSTLAIYWLARKTGLEQLFKRYVKEGVRSYIYVQK